ncbi:MAG: hypothetical protein JWM34_3474 [Ilumatobacteraceae bacterium]|nr:hypothetical protein [Ilumatobacteraceae bacterium]
MSEVIDEQPVVLPGLDAFRLMREAERDAAWMLVERESRRLAALTAEMLQEVAVSQSYTDDHHRGPVQWVQAVSNCTRSTARRSVRTAATLALLPTVAAVHAAGEIGPDQVKMLADLYANPRARDHLAESEDLLLGHARTLPAADFGVVCRSWEAHADPDGAHRDHEQSRANRTAGIHFFGNEFELVVRGDALTGEAFSNVLLAHVEAEYQTDVAERLAAYGDDADQHPLARTPAQRAFDAAAAIWMKSAGTRGSTAGDPLIVIHCNQAAFEYAVREYFGTPQPPTDPSERVRYCQTAGGHQVDPKALAAAALIGKVQRLVSDPRGLTINLGRSSRLFRGSARDAVLLAGDRCCWPGCGLRAGQIQVDHMDPWVALFGNTDPTNGAPMCGKHNRGKHSSGVTTTCDETGWHHFRADGTEIAPRTPMPAPNWPDR